MIKLFCRTSFVSQIAMCVSTLTYCSLWKGNYYKRVDMISIEILGIYTL